MAMTIFHQCRATWSFALLAVCLISGGPVQAQSRSGLEGAPSATTRIFGSPTKISDEADGRGSRDVERGQPVRRGDLRNQVDQRSQPPSGNGGASDMDEGADEFGDEFVEEYLYKDFSRYIRNTSGKIVNDALPIKRSNARAPKLPDSYLLGSGDEIEVQAWGSISSQYHLTVDEGGRVFIPDVGSVPVAGVKASDLSQVLTGYFKRIYKGFELRALVSHARAITVYVAGEAKSVGLKNVTASHTLLSATLGFARPSEGGSRRFVTFQRGKEAAQTFDLYCFFRQQCPTLPEVLSDGDVIRVPARGKLVAISGLVSRPGIYELAPGETLRDLLKYAGGATVVADLQRVQLYSFTGSKDSVRQFKIIDLSKMCPETGRNCSEMNDGDYLDIQSKFTLVKGVVTIAAAGVDPVKIEFKPGLRLTDAMQGIVEKLIPDKILKSLNSNYSDSLGDIDEQLRRLELDAITLYRMDNSVREYQSQRVSYLDAKASPQGKANIELQDGDILTIDESDEFKSRRDKLSMPVQIFGEVAKPGRYRVPGKTTLGDVLSMAGGLGESAAPWGVVVLRKGTGKSDINREVLDRAFAAVQDYQTRQEQLETSSQIQAVQLRSLGDRGVNTGITGGTNTAQRRLRVIELMEGRDVVYLAQSGNTSDIKSMNLSPSDIIIVPHVQDTFSCYGAVFKPGDFFVGLDGSLASKDAVARCGLIEEISGNVYQFIARESRVCRKGWFSSCPDVRGGDVIVAVPEAITKQGAAAALQWLDVTLRSLTALATVKVLAN